MLIFLANILNLEYIIVKIRIHIHFRIKSITKLNKVTFLIYIY